MSLLRFRLAALAATACVLSGSATAAQADFNEVGRQVAIMLQNSHYASLPFNAETGQRFLDDYLKQLDPSKVYFTAADGVRGWSDAAGLIPPSEVGPEHKLLTFCVLTLRNGFTVTGESACASPENFDAEIGRKIARQNAVQKIWPLMGYELRSKLAA